MHDTASTLTYDDWSFWILRCKLLHEDETDLIVLTPEECEQAAGFMTSPLMIDDDYNVIAAETSFHYYITPDMFKNKYIFKVMRARRRVTASPGDTDYEFVNGYMVSAGTRHKMSI